MLWLKDLASKFAYYEGVSGIWYGRGYIGFSLTAQSIYCTNQSGRNQATYSNTSILTRKLCGVKLSYSTYIKAYYLQELFMM